MEGGVEQQYGRLNTGGGGGCCRLRAATGSWKPIFFGLRRLFCFTFHVSRFSLRLSAFQSSVCVFQSAAVSSCWPACSSSPRPRWSARTSRRPESPARPELEQGLGKSVVGPGRPGEGTCGCWAGVCVCVCEVVQCSDHWCAGNNCWVGGMFWDRSVIGFAEMQIDHWLDRGHTIGPEHGL